MRKTVIISLVTVLIATFKINAQVTKISEVQVSDSGLYFDGEKVSINSYQDKAKYDYAFGRVITPHGDCIKTFGKYVFLTWYKGGEEVRNVMLSRYNTETGNLVTIEFAHKHNGYLNNPHIGESHNTIAVGICPLDSTIHLLYDMHAYGPDRPSDGSLKDDYFRYQFSVRGGATVLDSEFKDNLFSDKRLYLKQGENYIGLTYPEFFLNLNDELMVKMREGGHTNGKYMFAKYNPDQKWSDWTDFNFLTAKDHGDISYNWGLYGSIKYQGGKMRIGFSTRYGLPNDRYYANNGFHYAYSNDPTGKTGWFTAYGEPFDLPLLDPDFIKISEPGDVVDLTGKDEVRITSGADWAVNDREDIHFVTRVNSTNVHTYKKGYNSTFTTSTDFPGGNLYGVGNKMYLIGLENNRPVVHVAEGGTNNWRQVYKETEGKTFSHGRPIIQNGILYYYLMERSSGDARPLHLVSYDLDVDTTPYDASRELAFMNIQEGEEVDLAEELKLEAMVGSAFKEVTLWSGVTNFGTHTTAPYVWSVTDLQKPSQTFKLIAKDSADVKCETSLTIKVVSHEAPATMAASMVEHLLFYCPLNEDGKDLSEHQNHAIPGSALTYEAGKMGNGAAFSYTEGSYLTSADSVYKYSYPTAYTVAFWLKVSEYGSRGDIIQPVGGRTLLYSNGDLSFRTFHQKKSAAFSLSDNEKDEWFHVAMVIDQREGQTQHKFYINGEQRGDNPSGYELETDKPQSIGRIVFGAGSDSALARNFSGMIDELYMFNTVLSDDEIKLLMETENLIASSNSETTNLDRTISENMLSIYPVPVRETLNINGVTAIFAKVYDISGKLVLEMSNMNQGIKVTRLTSGLYILHLTDKNGKKYTTRFVKE